MLEVSEISFGYSGSRLNLDRISFTCSPGQCTAILGNNGCGKTTLMKVIDRILTPLSGAVTLDGVNLSSLSRGELSRRLAYVAQDNRPGHSTVFDSILLGRKPYIRIQPTEEDYGKVESVIRMLHLESYAMRYADELSGGEYQKVVLGRALAQEPQVLLLDEPTSNLDMKNQKEVLELVRDIVKDTGIMALIVIHDINSALRFCNHFVYMKDSRVYVSGGHETATSENISEVYGLPVAVEHFGGLPVVISC